MTETQKERTTWEMKVSEIIRRQATYSLKKERAFCDNQFIPIPHALLDNPRYRNDFLRKKRFITYYWMRRYVVRAPHPHDPFELHRFYWMRGELVSCLSLERIAADLAMPVSTVRGHINQLEEDGIIKVDRYDAEVSPTGKRAEVYILGTCLEADEKWFIDEAFANTKHEEDLS
jgi:DNA-binding transcriptional ArsR family regulator